MSLYEGMFLLDSRQANRDWDGSVEKLKAILTKHGAEVVRCLKWGERRLAYEIDRRRRAAYVLAHFNALGDAVSRIYREVELSELIHRALILKIQTLPAEDELRVLSEGRGLRRSGRFGGPRPAAREREAPKQAAAATAESKESDAAPGDAEAKPVAVEETPAGETPAKAESKESDAAPGDVEAKSVAVEETPADETPTKKEGAEAKSADAEPASEDA